MTKLLRIGAIALVSSLGSCVHRQSAAEAASRLVGGVVTVGNAERTFWYRLPPGEVRGVILAFHGAGGLGRLFERTAAQFADEATVAGFAVVYPDGIKRRWNDGRPEGTGADDIAFFDALLGALHSHLKLPVERVFVTGLSNGALFSYRLACERAQRIAAIAPVAATMGEVLSKSCVEKTPMPVLMIMGTADPLVPYTGGAVRLPTGKERGMVLSAEASWAFWSARSGCQGAQESTTLPKGPMHDFAVEVKRWTGCPPGMAGERYDLVGAGHSWPGGRQVFPSSMVGDISQTFKANAVILEFFKGIREKLPRKE